MGSEYIWWEKTVEYAYVLLVARTKRGEFLAPLAGVHERGGDAVNAIGSKMILIEFKRNEAALGSEVDKFSSKGSYEDAKELLGGRDGHHFLVFGKLSIDNPGERPRLQLRAQTYFRGVVHDVSGLSQAGTEKEDFDGYLTEFLRYKNEGSESGSVTVGPEAYSVVAGVSDNGEVLNILPLEEYAQLALGAKPTNDPPTQSTRYVP